MTSIVNAKDVIFAFNGIVIGCAQATTLTVTQAIDAATCTASGAWSQGSPGVKSWTASVNAIYRQFDSTSAPLNVSGDDVFDAIDSGAEIDIEYGLNTTGSVRYRGKAFVSNWTLSKPETGNVTWSADLTGNGPLEKYTLQAADVLPIPA
jgi:hypothetical protein